MSIAARPLRRTGEAFGKPLGETAERCDRLVQQVDGLGELVDPYHLLEYLLISTGVFAEPLTFSLRVAGLLKDRASDFDVVHDNQCLGYGML